MLAAFRREREVITVSEFVRLLDVHKSTASRLAATLIGAGFLERSPQQDGFVLGPELLRLGLLSSGGTLAAVAAPILSDLAERTGETAVLSVAAGDEAVDIAEGVSRHVISANTWVGRRTPVHACSDGKVLLAFGAARLPEGELRPRTPETITDRSTLELELDRVRDSGWACSVGECETALTGVAAPVFGSSGCIAALSVSGPDFRMTPARLSEVALPCVAAASTLSRRIGGRDETMVEVGGNRT
jgi:DNA-binding IclR family transcriptional regulator